jgi:hypothetical protein
MGFRFRRSLRIAKGVRINLSKGGASLSLRTRGASLNIGRKGIRETVSLPGSGLSYSTMLHSGPPTAFPRAPARHRLATGLLWLVAILSLAVIGGMALATFAH